MKKRIIVTIDQRMEITFRTFSFRSKWDGVVIHGICLVPEQPVAILQMVHGMCEHKERYLLFMEKMAERGYIVLMQDNRGHGESIRNKEDLGYCYSSMDRGYVEDIYRATRFIRKAYPNLPVILYGHSMGSLAVRAYLKQHDDAIDGLIISGSPSYNEIIPLGRLLVRFVSLCMGERFRSKRVQHMVLGGFEKKFEGGKNAWLSVDPAVGSAFERDPLCAFTYTANGFMTLLNLETIVYKDKGYLVRHPELPILFLSGNDDPCYVNEKKWRQAIDRLKKLGYDHIREIRYEGMRHEIHNEKNRELVFMDVDRFCHRVSLRSKQNERRRQQKRAFTVHNMSK